MGFEIVDLATINFSGFAITRSVYSNMCYEVNIGGIKAIYTKVV